MGEFPLFRHLFLLLLFLLFFFIFHLFLYFVTFLGEFFFFFSGKIKKKKEKKRKKKERKDRRRFAYVLDERIKCWGGVSLFSFAFPLPSSSPDFSISRLLNL
jgi:hypothetical protein